MPLPYHLQPEQATFRGLPTHAPSAALCTKVGHEHVAVGPSPTNLLLGRADMQFYVHVAVFPMW